jgi:hypothetical protein
MSKSIDNNKSDFLAKLLSQSHHNTRPNIVEVGCDNGDITDRGGTSNDVKLSSNVDDSPTLLEMMLQDHREAKKVKDDAASDQMKKSVKSFGGGFKKGFLGGAPKKAPSAEGTASSSTTPPIPTIRKQEKPVPSSIITEEVQRAMVEDESPQLRQLRQGGILFNF